MNTTEIGNKLEDDLYNYLVEQKNRGALIFDAHPAELCKIFKKKKYYCREREADVEFDVVLEIFAKNRAAPHLRVIFECKNYTSNVPEDKVTEFSDKIGRIFQNSSKGVIVSSSRLQSGAEKIALKRGIGIARYVNDGLEIIADRSGKTPVESKFVKSQILDERKSVKALKFSAYFDGIYSSSVSQLIQSFEQHASTQTDGKTENVPHCSKEILERLTKDLLDKIQYLEGHVDLTRICEALELKLNFSNEMVLDEDGNQILGSARFDERTIQINYHENKLRERFTIAHEVAHFYLEHDKYLRSETVVANDLLSNASTGLSLNYERLEYQANTFASFLLLPNSIFIEKVAEYAAYTVFRDRGHGLIYVDDQECNYRPYNAFINEMSNYFQVSKQAIEVKLKRAQLVTDERSNPKRISMFFQALI